MALHIKDNGIIKPVKYPFITKQVNFKQLNFAKGNWASVPGCMPTYSNMQGKSQVFVIDFRRGNTTDNMVIIGQNQINAVNQYPRGWFCNCTNNVIAMNISNDGSSPLSEITIRANEMSVNEGRGTKAFQSFGNEWIRLKCFFYQNGNLLTYKMEFRQGDYIWSKSATTTCPDETGIYRFDARKYQLFLGTVRYSNSFDTLRFTGQLRRFLIGSGDSVLKTDENDRPYRIEHLYDFNLRAGKMANGGRDVNWDMTLYDLVGNDDGIFKGTNDNPAENYYDSPNYVIHPLEMVANCGGQLVKWGGLKRWCMSYSAGVTNGALSGVIPKTGYTGYIFNVSLPDSCQMPGYTYDNNKGQKLYYSASGKTGTYIESVPFSIDLFNPAYDGGNSNCGAMFGISFYLGTVVNDFEKIWEATYDTKGWGEFFFMFEYRGTLYLRWRDKDCAICPITRNASHTLTVCLRFNSAQFAEYWVCLDGVLYSGSAITEVKMWTGWANRTNFEFALGHARGYGNKMHGYFNKWVFVGMKFLKQHCPSEYPDTEHKIRQMLLGLCNNGIDGGYF